jgi:hypothetical protein
MAAKLQLIFFGQYIRAKFDTYIQQLALKFELHLLCCWSGALCGLTIFACLCT